MKKQEPYKFTCTVCGWEHLVFNAKKILKHINMHKEEIKQFKKKAL